MCTDAAPRGTIVLGWAVCLLTCPHDRLIKVCKIMVAACKSSRAATASLTQKTARPSRLPRNIETSSGSISAPASACARTLAIDTSSVRPSYTSPPQKKEETVDICDWNTICKLLLPMMHENSQVASVAGVAAFQAIQAWHLGRAGQESWDIELWRILGVSWCLVVWQVFSLSTHWGLENEARVHSHHPAFAMLWCPAAGEMASWQPTPYAKGTELGPLPHQHHLCR